MDGVIGLCYGKDVSRKIKEPPSIEFQATVYKVQTLVDEGIRLTLDMPETEIRQAAMLMECKREGIALLITAKATS